MAYLVDDAIAGFPTCALSKAFPVKLLGANPSAGTRMERVNPKLTSFIIWVLSVFCGGGDRVIGAL